ncbi:MAG: hypothetical protein HKN02_02690 [Rhodobacteraceae bacterium]|nr:hypothetical protein [Paracoccaceae bacterium]
MKQLRILLIATLMVLPLTGFGQTDDRGLVQRTLEDNLSGEGRTVRIEGFSGALSAQASIDRLTVADDDGVWLDLTGVTLDWTRSALLRGRVEVRDLTAEVIELSRLPGAAPGADVPDAEASGFSLPDLPVSIKIGNLAAERIVLGDALFGEAAELTLSGSMSLAGGEGTAAFNAERTDGKQGLFKLNGAFENATRTLTLDLLLEEGPAGIVSRLATLPGQPALRLAVTGAGPLDNFAANLTLATDGRDRLEGDLTIAAVPAGQAFTADLNGDIAPLFAPDYQAFFGPSISVSVAGIQETTGLLDITDLTLNAATIDLTGALAIGADGLPLKIAVTGEIADPSGEPVLLPLTGPRTRVDAVTLTADFNAAAGETWTATAAITGLQREGFSAGRATLDGTGQITRDPAQAVNADLTFRAKALDFGDPATEAALGEDVTGAATITWAENAPLELRTLELTGESYALTTQATVTTTDGDVAVAFDGDVAARDLSVFAGLAQRALSGAAEAGIAGTAQPIAGTFDVDLSAVTTNLTVGQPEADRLLRGTAELAGRVLRDTEGTRIENFTVQSTGADIAADATLATDASRIAAKATLRDTGVIAEGLDGPIELDLGADQTGPLWAITGTLGGAGITADLDGTVLTTGDSPRFDGTVNANIAQIAPFSDRAGRALNGAVTLNATGTASADLATLAIDGTAQTTDLRIGEADADALLAGETNLKANLSRDGDTVEVTELTVSNPQLSLDVVGTGNLGGDSPRFDGTVAASIAEIAPLSDRAGRTLGGAAALDAVLTATADLSTLAINGTAQTTDLRIGEADADALLAGETNLKANLSRNGDTAKITELTASNPQLSLDVTGTGDLGGESPRFDGIVVASIADIAPLSDRAGRTFSGAASLDAALSATADLSTLAIDGTAQTTDLRVGQSDADALLAGETNLRADLSRTGDAIDIADLTVSNPQLSLEAAGALAPRGGTVSLTARLADISTYVPGFSGPATATGDIGRLEDGRWSVDLTANGPGGTRIDTQGSVAEDFGTVDLRLDGSAPLALANRFIAPRSVSGQLGFDLAIRGAPALSAVSGTLRSENARAVAPDLRLVANDIDSTVTLGGGRAEVDSSVRLSDGGRVAITGPVTLTAPFEGQIAIALNNVVLSDPELYRTLINGRVSLAGPLAGGARIDGALQLGDTELQVPSGTSGVGGDIPVITHLNEPAAVRATRDRAGLIARDAPDDSGPARAYPLRVTVEATNRIFIRGRGLDAELGGALTLGGTTADIIPQGQFDLIRGRLDILGQRLTLTEGRATLQGDFDAFLRLVATTQADDVTVRVIIEGPASEPEISFVSEPELPEDEVLARLLFGRGLDTLSPLQAAQLAGAVATLAGRGGDGIIARLRQNFGLDDLDVTSNEDGGTAVRAGKYISDNVYTDVTVDSEGGSEVTLNLNISPSLTARGSVDEEGQTGIGLFFERDY